jgi:hypothetical protein
MKHRLAARTCRDMKNGHEAWTCSMHMQHGKAAWTCSTENRTDMQNEQAAKKSSRDMQQEHAYTLLKTLAFPLAEGIWTLEPGFQGGAAKGGKGAFFLSRSALSLFSRSIFFPLPRSFFICRSRLHESSKNHGRPPLRTRYIYSKVTCVMLISVLFCTD